MISLPAIRKFLNRELRDSRSVKDLPDAALDRRIRALLPRPRFHTQPRTCQKALFLLCAKYPGYMGLLEMGLGKTWVMLQIIKWLLSARRIKRAIVFVPNTANIQGWIDEANRHAPSLHVIGLDQSTRKGRIAALHDESDVVVTTYMGWCSLICKTVKAKRKKKNEWKIHESTDKRYRKFFQCAIYDEITLIMNQSSLFARAVHRMSRSTAYHYGLTGTPFGSNPEALWSQFYATDLGETLGQTLGLFREAMFLKKDNIWTGYYDYEFDKAKSKLLARMIRHRSLRYRTDECNDLPPLIRIEKRVTYPEENWRYQEAMVKQIRSSKGDREIIENAWHYLRRLASGYMSIKMPDGNRTEVVFKDNPKLDLLLEDIRDLPPDKKAIVFLDYQKTGDIVCDRLDKEGFKHLRLYGKTSNKGRVVKQFQTDPKARILVSSTSGAFGHNLQCANYELMFETTSDPIRRQQMEKRAHRDGQLYKVFVIDYITKGSIEEKIIRAIKAGKDLFEQVVDDPKDFVL